MPLLSKLGRFAPLPCSLFVCAAIVCAVAAYVVADDSQRRLLSNTAYLVGCVELLALPIALLLAFLLVRTNIAGRSAALLLCSSLLFVPLYLQLAGWDAALGRLGWQTLLFARLEQPWLSHWRGAVFVHAVYAIPWAACLMAAAFSRGDRQEEEAALLEGSAWQVLQRVTWRQLLSGTAVAAAWIFVITAGEMTVTNIYLVSTYAEDVYNFHAASGDVEGAVIHNLPLSLFTAALVFTLLAVIQPARLFLSNGSPYRWRLGASRSAMSWLVFIILVMLTAAPLLNLMERMGEDVVFQGNHRPLRVWSLEKLLRLLVTTPGKFRDEFSVTLLISATVALVAVPLSILAAWRARQHRIASLVSWLLALVALAIPAPVVGLGVIWLLNWNTPIHIYLYDETIVPPVLAILVRVLPLTFVAFWWALRTLDQPPLDAAALEGAGSLRQLFSIALPQRWPIVAVTALAAFVIASGDLSASILTIPPKLYEEPITRRMFGLIHAGVNDEVAAIGLVSWLGYLMAAAGAFWLLRMRTQAKT